jgi:flagellar motor switch protein FliN/FliY
MTEPTKRDVLTTFATSFIEAFAKGISEIGEMVWNVKDLLQAAPKRSDHDSVTVRLTLRGSLKGEVLMEFAREEAETLNGGINSEAESANTEADERLVQLLDKQKGRICLELLHTYGSFTIEPSLFVKQASEPQFDASDGISVVCSDDIGHMLHINIYIVGDLAKSLTLRPVPIGATVESDTNGTEQVNLDLVLEVELNVTVRFGQRQLTLREVLELTSGSVIELDRQVDEPVELLLDGKVIAKGEAVVVDGNYGLRITEVPQLISPALLM